MKSERTRIGRAITVIMFFLISAVTVTKATAQTLQKGRELFLNGNYSEARPIMEKYLKQKPSDASRNFWYGVCCFETGNKDMALPYLKTAAEKKINKAYRYIGEYYETKELYADAIDNYESFVNGLKADKELHDIQLEELYTHKADSIKNLYRMIRNTRKVCFIDSFLVNKKDLINSYMVDESVGSFFNYSDFFGTKGEGDVFLPEMATNVIFSRLSDDGKYKLYQRFKSFDRWVDETSVKGIDNDGNIRYPFLQNDGITIFFASDGSESMGGLDLFVSRLNSATGRFLKPENLGMPFNSEANDYLMVIDEVNNLGWFATDRRQPQDTVCIYVFVNDNSHETYNYEGGDTLAIHRAARLISIKESQTDPETVRLARQKLTLLAYRQTEEKEKGSFLFVIDDLTNYHELTDFRSSEARDLFQRWNKLKQQYAESAKRLEQERDRYHQSDKTDRQAMNQSLLQLESETEKADKEITDMEKEIRNTEIKFLQR